jgi:hypothetical protein
MVESIVDLEVWDIVVICVYFVIVMAVGIIVSTFLFYACYKYIYKEMNSTLWQSLQACLLALFSKLFTKKFEIDRGLLHGGNCMYHRSQEYSLL